MPGSSTSSWRGQHLEAEYLQVHEALLISVRNPVLCDEIDQVRERGQACDGVLGVRLADARERFIDEFTQRRKQSGRRGAAVKGTELLEPGTYGGTLLPVLDLTQSCVDCADACVFEAQDDGEFEVPQIFRTGIH